MTAPRKRKRAIETVTGWTPPALPSRKASAEESARIGAGLRLAIEQLDDEADIAEIAKSVAEVVGVFVGAAT